MFRYTKSSILSGSDGNHLNSWLKWNRVDNGMRFEIEIFGKFSRQLRNFVEKLIWSNHFLPLNHAEDPRPSELIFADDSALNNLKILFIVWRTINLIRIWLENCYKLKKLRQHKKLMKSIEIKISFSTAKCVRVTYLKLKLTDCCFNRQRY